MPADCGLRAAHFGDGAAEAAGPQAAATGPERDAGLVQMLNNQFEDLAFLSEFTS
jgi:hypothetical protein